MQVVTVTVYREGAVEEAEPISAMVRLFGLCEAAGLRPRGSTDRFQVEDSLRHTLVFEVQDKREVV